MIIILRNVLHLVLFALVLPLNYMYTILLQIKASLSFISRGFKHIYRCLILFLYSRAFIWNYSVTVNMYSWEYYVYMHGILAKTVIRLIKSHCKVEGNNRKVSSQLIQFNTHITFPIYFSIWLIWQDKFTIYISRTFNLIENSLSLNLVKIGDTHEL